MATLARAALQLLDATSDHALARALGYDVNPGWATFPEALEPTPRALPTTPTGARWALDYS